MHDLKTYITKIIENKKLNKQEAAKAFDIMMSGEAKSAQISAFLTALRCRGETVEEIAGAVEVMRAKMTTVNAPKAAIDIVGTGGDSHGTFNISTATALVVAGAGVPVAKHGNKAFSSLSGAADVLSVLGVDLNANQDRVEKSIAKAKIGFLMAPIYHSAMRHVGPTRAEIGIRTIFNILGPMCNPASVKFLLVGTYDPKWLNPMAETLCSLGVEKAWVVHGNDGLDELTTTGPSKVVQVANGTITAFEIKPDDANLPISDITSLKGGSPEDNASAITKLLEGAQGPFRDIVLLNAAAALVVAEEAVSLKNGVKMAAEAIDSGKAFYALKGLLTYTGQSQ